MTECLLGIDLGTSSVKALIVDAEGVQHGLGHAGYAIESPHPNWAEQDPEIWWASTKQAIQAALAEASKIGEIFIAGVGLSGQMHGLVCLDSDGIPLRPAIIHADQRTEEQIKSIYRIIGKEELLRRTLNVLYPGFLLPSLLWIKEHELDVYRNVRTLLLPKDYIRYRLTGTLGTDFSDASGSLAFDTARREWAHDVIKGLKLDPGLFPPCSESVEIAGHVTPEAAKQSGLTVGIPVIFGGSDQPMQALGNGVLKEGEITCTIGTSGQVFTPTSRPVVDPGRRIHTFCSCIPESWYSMGAMMCAGLAFQWLKNSIFDISDNHTLNEEAASIPAGSEGILFLPYLIGERTPHLNPNARGMFFGLKASHTRGHIVHAVMEGVAFGLKDSLEIFKSSGIKPIKVIASGGGAQSVLWLHIQADIYGEELLVNEMGEQACLGAAITAGVGCGIFKSIEEACNKLVRISSKPVRPNPEANRIYENRFPHFQALYKQVCAFF